MTHWHIIQCPGGQEAKAKIVLGQMGHDEIWWPVKKLRLTGFQLDRARAKGGKASEYRVVPWAPGYVFTFTEDIDLYRVNSAGQLRMRVLAPGGTPYTMTDEDMARMKDYPERVKALIADIRAREAAEIAARRPIVGGPAKITNGPMEGRTGDVVGYRVGEWRVNLGAIEVWVPERDVEKAA